MVPTSSRSGKTIREVLGRGDKVTDETSIGTSATGKDKDLAILTDPVDEDYLDPL